VWQYGPAGISVDPKSFGDENSIYYNEEEFKVLGSQHAKKMLAKPVPTQT
jgi:mannan endo-1,4-beta-mannosidase